jgi:hypothetical protein
MDPQAGYTKFPNLYDVVSCDQQRGALNTVWPLDLPNELLILSWATLLQSYTDTADPVFLFDGQAIQVDVALGSWTEVQFEDTIEHERRHTSLALHSVSSSRSDLRVGDLIHS